MNVKIAGFLAAASMVLTSVTVWSVTEPASRLRFASVEMPPEPRAKTEFLSSGTLNVEARAGHAQLERGSRETFVFVDVTAPAGAVDRSPPVNLSIAIDRSGSMKGKRLRNALDAARGMIRRLRVGDFVNVVSYNTTTSVDLPATRIDDDSRERAVAALGRISASGDTCVSCGVEAALGALGDRKDMVNHVLLLSDGEANSGVRSLDGFRGLAERVRAGGVAISSIGVDVDYNERVLGVLARESNGRHHFVEDSADLPATFDRELTALASTVATGASLAIDLPAGIELAEVYDRAFRRNGRTVEVPLGDLAAADRRRFCCAYACPIPRPRSSRSLLCVWNMAKAPGGPYASMAISKSRERRVTKNLHRSMASSRRGSGALRRRR